MRVLRAGRGPAVPGRLSVFDPLEIDAATLPMRDKGGGRATLKGSASLCEINDPHEKSSGRTELRDFETDGGGGRETQWLTALE